MFGLWNECCIGWTFPLAVLGFPGQFWTSLAAVSLCKVKVTSALPHSWIWSFARYWEYLWLFFFFYLFLNQFWNNLYLFKLYNQETRLEWIIFHDVTVTSKIYVRTVCPVRYEWVKDLLPRLHQIDAYELSSVAREEVTEEEITRWKHKEDLRRQCGKHITGLHLCHM